MDVRRGARTLTLTDSDWVFPDDYFDMFKFYYFDFKTLPASTSSVSVLCWATETNHQIDQLICFHSVKERLEELWAHACGQWPVTILIVNYRRLSNSAMVLMQWTSEPAL